MSGLPQKELSGLVRLDPSFAWSVESETSGAGWRAFVLSLVSQTWRPPVPCDRSVWRHWMTVTIPDQVDSVNAFLHVGGGINDGPPPEGPLPYHAVMAVETRSVVVEVGQVPNQPIRFEDSPGNAREEDELIANLHARYDGAQGPSGLTRAPMVRSIAAALTPRSSALRKRVGAWTLKGSWYPAVRSAAGPCGSRRWRIPELSVSSRSLSTYSM